MRSDLSYRLFTTTRVHETCTNVQRPGRTSDDGRRLLPVSVRHWVSSMWRRKQCQWATSGTCPAIGTLELTASTNRATVGWAWDVWRSYREWLLRLRSYRGSTLKWIYR